MAAKSCCWPIWSVKRRLAFRSQRFSIAPALHPGGQVFFPPVDAAAKGRIMKPSRPKKMEYTYERFKSFHGKSPAPYGDRAAADRGHRHDRAAPFAGPRRAAGRLSQPRAHGCGHAPAERLRLLRGQPVRADLRLRRQRTVSSGATGRALGAGMVYRRGADGAFVAADPGHGGELAHGSFADRLPGVLVSDGLFRPVCAVPRPARCRGAAFPPSADVDAAGLRRPFHPDALRGGIAEPERRDTRR